MLVETVETNSSLKTQGIPQTLSCFHDICYQVKDCLLPITSQPAGAPEEGDGVDRLSSPSCPAIQHPRSSLHLPPLCPRVLTETLN